jgi:hypothetical protein
VATGIVYTDSDSIFGPASLIGLVHANSSQDYILSDVASVPTAFLSTNQGTADLPLDEDYSTLPGKYTVVNTASPFKALTDRKQHGNV